MSIMSDVLIFSNIFVLPKWDQTASPNSIPAGLERQRLWTAHFAFCLALVVVDPCDQLPYQVPSSSIWKPKFTTTLIHHARGMFPRDVALRSLMSHDCSRKTRTEEAESGIWFIFRVAAFERSIEADCFESEWIRWFRAYNGSPSTRSGMTE